jgi:hypothetical protein
MKLEGGLAEQNMYIDYWDTGYQNFMMLFTYWTFQSWIRSMCVLNSGRVHTTAAKNTGYLESSSLQLLI